MLRLLPLDAAWQIIRPAVLWSDQHSEPQATAVRDAVGALALMRITCNPSRTAFTAFKIIWLRDREPPRLLEPLRTVRDYDAIIMDCPGIWPHFPISRMLRFHISGSPGTDGAQQGPRVGDLGEAFPARQTPSRDVILQPPKPQIIPSAKVLQLALEHDTGAEAAD